MRPKVVIVAAHGTTLFKQVKEVSNLFHKEATIREIETWLRKVMHSQNTQKIFYRIESEGAKGC